MTPSSTINRICERRLCETVDVETVATTLTLSEQNHAEELKKVWRERAQEPLYCYALHCRCHAACSCNSCSCHAWCWLCTVGVPLRRPTLPCCFVEGRRCGGGVGQCICHTRLWGQWPIVPELHLCFLHSLLPPSFCPRSASALSAVTSRPSWARKGTAT